MSSKITRKVTAALDLDLLTILYFSHVLCHKRRELVGKSNHLRHIHLVRGAI